MEIAAAAIFACIVAWDLGRRYIRGAHGTDVDQLRAALEAHEERTAAELKDLSNKLTQTANRVPTRRAHNLTGLGR